MGQVLHGSATTTEAVRRAIQHSQESLRVLARRYGINQKTVAKWKRRNSVADLPTGPKDARSTVLSIAEEAIIVAFRKHTLLPLDDCLYALQPTIPHLTRSSLHRCLQRHGISQLPQIEGEVSAKRKFKTYPIGYFHIDIAEVRTAQGKLYLLVAIDRTSKFAFVELHEKVARSHRRPTSCAVSIAAVPYKVHTVLTDNGLQFTDLPRIRRSLRALPGIAMAGMDMPSLQALTQGIEGTKRARVAASYTSAFTIGCVPVVAVRPRRNAAGLTQRFYCRSAPPIVTRALIAAEAGTVFRIIFAFRLC